MADMSYQVFVALDGTALEGGSIFLGVADADPEQSPIPVYWDPGLTVLADQPLRTSGGVIVRDGTPADVYAAVTAYSIRVRDRSGTVVWYKATTGGNAASRLTFPIPAGPPGADSEVPGPADNTYNSLALLAASDITRKVASLAAAAGQDGIRYYWTPGDFTGKIDGVATVASTTTPITQGAWVDPLRQPTGFTLVKYKRSEAGTYARTAQQLERIGGFDGQISIMHWVDPALDEGILAASNGTPITASLQAAFDEAPLDRPLIFPSGEIRTTGTVYNPRALSMEGNGCTWRFYANDAALDMLVIEANRDVRNFFLRNFANISPSFAARHAIRMFSDGNNRALIGFDISNNLISGGSGGNALNIGGLGTHIGSVWNNQLIEGVYDYGADRIAYTENNFFGLKTAITLDKIGGAYNTIIANNAMVSRDGGVNVLNGDLVFILNNQIEQFPSYGANQSAFGSQITGYGQSRPSRSVVVRGNNLAGGGNCLAPVTLVAQTRDWVFEDNQFALGSTGLDMRILSDSCKYTAIRENFYRGTRDNVDAGDPIALFDNGAATRGAWKGAGTLAFSNGWSAGTDFGRFVSPDKDSSVRFTGILIVGTSAAVGDTVLTLPEGYKPRAGQLLLCGNGADNNVSKLMVNPDGTVKVAGPMPAQGTSIYLPPGGYRSRTKDTYEAGVV